MTSDNEIKGILETALDRERKGHDFYKKAALSTRSEKARHMFEWLSRVELTHIDKLSKQIEALRTMGKLVAMKHDQAKRIGTHDLPKAPEVSGQVTADTGELQALQLGINAEREAAAFYAKAAGQNKDLEAKALLTHLSDDEKEHLAVLEEEYNWLKTSGEYFTIHRFQIP